MKEWIKCAGIRAIKTMCQTAIALIGTSATGIIEVDWAAVISASALAGVLSILTSIAGMPEYKMKTANNEEVQAEKLEQLYQAESVEE